MVKKILKVLLTIIKWILIILAVLLFSVLLVRFIGQRITSSPTKDYKISEVYKVKLAGKEQKVLIESKNSTKKILVMFGGELGLPIPFGIGYRNNYSELAEKYTIVQWDLYGTGKNQGTIKSFDEYIPMLDDLISYLNKNYQDSDIYLLSYSYGNIVSVKYGLAHPEKIKGIISLSPIISNSRYINKYYEELKDLNLTDTEKNKLEECINKPDNASLKEISEIAKKYIEDYQGESIEINEYNKYRTHILISPDYTIIDLYNIYTYDKKESYKNLTEELNTLDMKPIYKNNTVPTLIIYGDKDRYSSGNSLEDLKSDNNRLIIKKLNNNGHIISDGNWSNIWKLLDNYIESISN